MEREQEIQLLGLTEAEKLAANCPRCFGPPIYATLPHTPDCVVCIDANFQQRRHESASVPITGQQTFTPELFMEPRHVEDMRKSMDKGAGDDEIVSMCHYSSTNKISFVSLFLHLDVDFICMIGSVYRATHRC